MITRYRAALNDKQLDAVAADIMITDISYTAPIPQIVASALAGRNGMHVQGKTYGVASVTVSFEIHEANVSKRQEACKKIQGWARQGGWLTTNDKAGLRLRVECSALPEIRSALRWTDKLSVTFTAYDSPMWESIFPEVMTLTGAANSAEQYMDGTADSTPVDVAVKNTGGTAIESVTVYAGDTVITLENVELGAGKSMYIGHTTEGFLYIRVDNASKLHRRTAESSDDLIVKCGHQSVFGYVCDGEASVTFTARGRYV